VDTKLKTQFYCQDRSVLHFVDGSRMMVREKYEDIELKASVGKQWIRMIDDETGQCKLINMNNVIYIVDCNYY